MITTKKNTISINEKIKKKSKKLSGHLYNFVYDQKVTKKNGQVEHFSCLRNGQEMLKIFIRTFIHL